MLVLLLNYKLLSLGDDDDKEYIISHNLWKNITEIGSFNIGEFYQVLFSAKHCRRNRLLEENSKVWKTLLNKHIENSSIIPKCKREAIYELILLTLRPSLTENPKTNLIIYQKQGYFHLYLKEKVIALSNPLNY